MSPHRSAADIRAGLKHPIIDADGHWVEYNPVFAERMRKVAGDKAADGFRPVGDVGLLPAPVIDLLDPCSGRDDLHPVGRGFGLKSGRHGHGSGTLAV